MSTLGPTIDATGISIPDFQDVVTQLQSVFEGIYGSDIDWDNSTQDLQWISTIAQAITDCNQTCVDIYNSFKLLYAQGTGLSSLVKLVGQRRQSSSASTCPVTVVGQAGITVNDGIVGDNQGLGTQWSLPTFTFPNTGTLNLTATCTQPGATSAQPNTLTVILTPTGGWQSVTNGANAASPGAPIQTDPELKQAAVNSTAGPALTILEAITAAISEVAGVSRLFVYENDTDINDANGQGPHSIYAVVQGGDPTQICTAIAQKKSPGTTTLGTTSETVADSNGVPNVINYYPLTEVTITVQVNVTKLAGWNDSNSALIQEVVAAYLSALAIGQKSYLNRLYAPATLNGDIATSTTGMTQTQLDLISATFNVTALLQSRPSDAPPAVQDVPIAFNEAAIATSANITVIAV
jgi:hypothetical protein